MVAYQDFVALSESQDSEQRGMAAHLAAMAYLGHDGPAEEHAALYAALIGFLDDPSVKVRAALAYGLLHAENAPRAILLSLLRDSAVISRAVVQYSPALLDADILSVTKDAEVSMLSAIAMREKLSQRVAEALIARRERTIILKLLAREDIALSGETMVVLTDQFGANDPTIRGALLKRRELPAASRLALVQAAATALSSIRIVKGAVAAQRLERIVRDGTDTALTSIGERSAVEGDGEFASLLIAAERVSTRIMLHSIVNGHVLFFADCLAALSDVPREKVFTILETGSRPALNALLARCGLGEAVRNLVARLIFHARSADLADDVTARHYVITALTEELIVDHDGNIPQELEEAFSYLSEQNVILARKAARGVMSAFAGDLRGGSAMPLPKVEAEPLAALTDANAEPVIDVEVDGETELADAIGDYVPAAELREPFSVVEVTLDAKGEEDSAEDDAIEVVVVDETEADEVEADDADTDEDEADDHEADEAEVELSESDGETDVDEPRESRVVEAKIIEPMRPANDQRKAEPYEEFIDVVDESEDGDEGDEDEDMGLDDAELIIARAIEKLAQLEAALNIEGDNDADDEAPAGRSAA